ncbi:KdsC family phosphatase [Brachyspira hampsonii]|uniref:KdsC family phosphatase n=1 Tax=Brachyspira hampsonii TaxID=1287055 RepID=UPI0019803220|nr:HAD hydrolase family protein [Brachyspira hampsonii]
MRSKIKLFGCDVDGTLTDAGMYYTESGYELKKFNTRDGMGMKLLKESGIITLIITSENTKIVENRAKKLKADYLYQGVQNKLEVIKELLKKLNINKSEFAYIGDDINDKEILEFAGLKACPNDAIEIIKNIDNILTMSKKGGEGAVREFIDNYIL